jgi:hypothetical protein
MSRMLVTLTVAVGVAATTAPASSRAAPPVKTARHLYGHWQIVGVAVSDTGVQALASDDPSYMGRRLTFTAARLSWDTPKQGATEAPCDRPSITPTPRDNDPDARATVRKIGGPASRAFAVACAAGSWGPAQAPSPTLLAMPDGTVGMWWYDGGLLKLRRVR